MVAQITVSKATLNNRVNAIIKSEKVTKAELGAFSREYLPYVYANNDIGMVNRLIAGLTPVNKKIAALYFTHFLAWEWTEETKTFGAKLSGKKLDAKQKDVETFLAEPANNIWTWAEENTKTEKRVPNYFKDLTRLLERGLKAEGDEKLTPEMIVTAIKTADGLSLDDFMKALGK